MLLVDPELGHGSYDDESMTKRLAAQLLKAVNGRFGLDLAMPMSLETVVATIPKPVFDLGDLWSLLRNRDEHRRVVFKFSELVTTHVASHYLFQGRMGYGRRAIRADSPVPTLEDACLDIVKRDSDCQVQD
jgi:hypothetical protein